jgi:hypothetical protein
VRNISEVKQDRPEILGVFCLSPIGGRLKAYFMNEAGYNGSRRFGITHLAIFAPNSWPSLFFPQNRMLLSFQQCIDKFSTRNIY